MIDTLKLSKRLREAQMPQAEAMTEGLAESLRERYETREYLDARVWKMETRIGLMLTAAVWVQRVWK